ncbi:monocarboxylate transporter 12-B isoform X2 [Takifugu rubripes]|uniref:Solute carrier family 16 member 12 n=1 Tax=Takifugu rubripes TaxID=31033 RepID=A0A674MZZ2_TAKRU|nr:monocarboxylate transporter 12-B-like isoform X2 [Takifugu rubripes]
MVLAGAMSARVGKEEKLAGDRMVPRTTSPPEGGWGWLVVAACFIATICTRAVTRCVSVFFVEFQLRFEKDYSSTAWIHSITDATTMLCAPLGGFLGNWLSCRVTIILGGLLSSAGLILSSFASSLEQLYFCTGVLTGSGIGTFILAPTVQMFIEYYSWRGALLVLGGLVSNLCVCGALMRPLHPKRAGRTPERDVENLVENSNTTVSKDTKEAECRQAEPKQLEINPTKDGTLVITANTGLKINRLENSKLGPESTALLSMPCLPGLTAQKLTNCILFSNKLTETMLGEAKLSEHKRRFSKEEPATVNPPSEPIGGTKPAPGGCLGFWANQKFQFLLAPNFLILSVSFCFLAYGCSTPVVHLVPYALSLGLEQKQAAFLMAIFGVSGIVGNITFGWIMDRKYLRRHRLLCYMLALGMEGLCCMFVPLLHSFPLLLTFSIFYGVFDGAYVALIPVVTSDVVDATNLTSALGVVYFLHAIPYLVSPPIGGWLVDRTGNYHATFLLSGASFMLSAVVPAAISLLKHQRKSNSCAWTHAPSPLESRWTPRDGNISDASCNLMKNSEPGEGTDL